jgi:hypothetical protein
MRDITRPVLIASILLFASIMSASALYCPAGGWASNVYSNGNVVTTPAFDKGDQCTITVAEAFFPKYPTVVADAQFFTENNWADYAKPEEGGVIHSFLQIDGEDVDWGDTVNLPTHAYTHEFMGTGSSLDLQIVDWYDHISTPCTPGADGIHPIGGGIPVFGCNYCHLPVCIVCEHVGCTYTPGYWKTHSSYGPSPHPDDAWDSVGGPDAAFFDSGQSWYQTFLTDPKGGNAYYILAHAYMAAVLNEGNDASVPSNVAVAIGDAAAILDKWSISKDIPKNDPDRAIAISLAETLDSYNNGLLGIPHCGDEVVPSGD